jgi:ubiquitin C-terminal hydrolase
MRKIMTPPPYDGEDVNFAAHFAPESTHPSRTWRYNLRGIVDHHGSHMGGHYSAQFCHPATQEWWWIDDESSSKLMSPRLKLPSNYMYLFRAITK